MDSSKELGTALAASVSESVRAMKSMEPRDAAAFQQGIMESLGSKQEVFTSNQVVRAVEHANSLAEQQIFPEDTTCDRDWSRRCPDGWDEVGSAFCIAPLSYKGGCRRIQKFEGTGERDKFAFSAACSSPWPCIGNDECPHGRDYEQCPVGWSLEGDGFCRAPSDAPMCASSVFRIGAIGIGEKQELSLECGLRWACRSSCDHRDYNASCPEGWTMESSLCLAPPMYAGECGSTDTTQMTERQKERFASLCGVNWPCAAATLGSLQGASSHVDQMHDGPFGLGIDIGKNDERDLGLPSGWFKLPSGPMDIEGGIHR